MEGTCGGRDGRGCLRHDINCQFLRQVLCVLLSIGGVTLVSFFSNSNNCPSTQNHTQNHTHINNDSYIPDHMVSHLNPKGVTCSPEKSTPLGYVVSLSLSLFPAMLYIQLLNNTLRGRGCNELNYNRMFIYSMLW